MKKVFLSVSILFSFYFVNGQSFRVQREQNQRKLNQYFEKNAFTKKQKDSLSKSFAGFEGGIPFFYKTDDSGANASSNIDELQNGSVSGLGPITGEGVTITIFDDGKALQAHEQFTTNRVINKEGKDDNAHATNVTGIIVGNGNNNLNAKGVLPNAKTNNYLFSVSELGTNFEKLDKLIGLNISNHSYGTNAGWNQVGNTYYWYSSYSTNPSLTYAGAYGQNDYNFDKIVYEKPEQIIIKSAGNYYGIGPSQTSPKYRYDSAQEKWILFKESDIIPEANCGKGYYCISFGSLAKNIITVGAVNQLTTPDKKYTEPNDVAKWSGSSAGPRKDGAVKPDLVAVGANMTLVNIPNNNSYKTGGVGTSYAAPIVTGIAGALTQIQRNLLSDSDFIFKADEMKAILTHTANDAGRPGPDVWYGWGLVDAKKAAQTLVSIVSKEAVFERQKLETGSVFTKEIKALGSEELKFSLSWIDPAIEFFTTDEDLLENHASRLVNDLDLRIIDTVSEEVFFPWRLDVYNPNANATKGDNTVDNIEQIIIENPVAGRKYRIEVSSKNELKNQEGDASTQKFILLGTGIDKNSLAIENPLITDLKIYPTRTNDFVFVDGKDSVDKVSVFDLNGKLLSESNSKSISLRNYPKAIYLIVVKTKQGIQTKKVIKE